MKSLVTGGAGFIGSHVARHCLGLGHEVVILDDLSGGCAENLPGGCEFVDGDIGDVILVAQLFQKHQFDQVYHLAAYAAEGLSHFIRRYNYSNNLVSSVNLLNEAVKNGVKTFVFTSSIAVYGAGQLPMREDQVPQPEDPYGIAKYAFELDLQAAHEMFGIDHIVFRPHNVYGEHQNIGDPYRNVVGIFMNRILGGDPMPVFGDGMQTRAFSYIDDVAPIIADSINVAGALNQTINLGTDTVHTVMDVAETVAAAFGVPVDIESLPGRNEVVDAYSDHSKQAEIFGEREAVSLEKGIARMAAWVKSVGARTGQDFENIEIMKKMPPSWLARCRGK